MSVNFSGTEILELGIKIEELGEEYYRNFAERSKDKEIKDLFEFLAGEEVNHKNTFMNIQKEWSSDDFIVPLLNEEVSAYLRSIVGSKLFSDKRSFIKNFDHLTEPVDIINQAIIFEKDTILFYYEMKSFTKEKNHKIIEKLIAEEKSHVLKLEAVKKELA